MPTPTSVTLNGHVYVSTQFLGYGYIGVNADTGLIQFPDSIFTDMLAQLAASPVITGGALAPTVAGAVPIADGTNWRLSTAVSQFALMAGVALGTTPATAGGVVRIPNGSGNGLAARNAANNANLSIFYLDGSNIVQVGTGAASVNVPVALAANAGLSVGGTITYSSFADSSTNAAIPSALVATRSLMWASTVYGAAHMGYGTTNDVTLFNRAGTETLGILANTTTVALAGALKYGGITLSPAVTGTGNMVLSASPTLTGTIAAAAATFSNAVAVNSDLTVTKGSATVATFNRTGTDGTIAVFNNGGVAALAIAYNAVTFGTVSASGITTLVTTGAVTVGARLLMNTAVTTNSVAGDIILANTFDLRSVNAAGSTTFSLIRMDGSDIITINRDGASTVKITGDILSASNGANDLGASGTKFRHAYLSGVLTAARIDTTADFSATYGHLISDTDSSVGTDVMIQFVRNGSNCGSITTTLALVTAYNTTSDARLKDLRALGDVGHIIDSIMVFDAAFKGDVDRLRYPMFTAQQLYEHAPWAVVVGGDDPERDPWMTDASKLIPLHHAELQRLRARVRELETVVRAA